MKRTLSAICIILAIVMVSAMAVGCDNKPADTTVPVDTNPPIAATTEAPGTSAPAATTEAPAATTEAPATTAEPATTAAPATDVIEIGTREELFAFAESINVDGEYYEEMTISITADINLDPTIEGGKNWVPIDGTGMYECTIEGNGHVINGMYITPDELADKSADYGYGFIGITDSGLTIQNITFANATIKPNTKHAGCVIGSVEGTDVYVTLTNVVVDNLYIDGGVGQPGDLAGICIRVGGLIGCTAFGGYPTIENCEVKNSKLIGFHNIGGLVGCVVLDMFDMKNNKVENVELHYSAGYSKSYDAAPSRYFADPFYNVSGEWEIYHGDDDAAEGNTFENIKSFDIAYEITYTDAEGKTADYEGDFPA